MGKLPGVLVWVSEVVATVRVSVPPAGAEEGLVTPSSSTVTAVLAPMVLPEPIEQMAMLSVGPIPQLPRDPVWPAAVTLLLVSVRTLAVGGSSTVIWLCAVPDIPPVEDVVNEIV